jgi:hypothetical protein
MKNPLLSRTWISPFVAVAFAVIAVTGVMLFFHIKSGPIMALHECFGWLFVVAGGVHLLLNLRPLLAYLKQPAALVSLGVGLMLVAFLWFGGAQHEGEHHRRGYGPPAQSPSSSSAMP